MKKLICFLFLYIIAILAATAQQDPQFSFNRLTQLTVNPGYAGIDGNLNGTILNRYQWDGIYGSPKTLIFSANGIADIFGISSGLGLNVVSDELGFQNNISVSFDYAYHLKTGFGVLGIGPKLGFYNISVNGDWLGPESEIHDPLESDPGIPQSESSQLAFDLGFGLFLRSNDYFFGASVTHVNQPTILLGETARTFLTRHYYLSAGYTISLTDPLFELQPAVYYKTDLASYQLDMTIDLVYKKRFSAGLNYRINDAVSVLMSFELNNGLKVGYAYDLMTSALAGYGNGSHEICLNYSLDLGKNRNKKYKSIRYL